MEKTFLYHALATGLSGRITLPFERLIEVQAASALPMVGGYSTSRVESFRFNDIISFAAASTITTGSETPESFESLATATVEGLNIFNIVTADRIVARSASKYLKQTGEYLSTFAGSHFENLRIAGEQVELEIAPERLKRAPRSEKVQFGSLAAAIDLGGRAGTELGEDGAFYVPGLGRLYFAESLVTRAYQTISMFRFVLGSAVHGHGSAATASTNGEAMPG